ncbi:MAG TPA: glycoside hydrolase family 16 protein [Armatimonadota bacterium]|jgi:beta-glucanase (GH16 family)
MQERKSRREVLRDVALAGLGAVCAEVGWAAGQPRKGAKVKPRSAGPDGSPKRPGWKLTFSDEFKGGKLDTRKWIDSYPNNVRTHSNNEQQYYATDGYSVSDGQLHLKAEKRAIGGMPYASGMVATYGLFAQQYGWFEISARFPKGKGYWPAFWLLPANKTWPPEIDILEILGHEPNRVYMTNHWRTQSGEHKSKGGSYVGPDFSTGFHSFAVEWKPDEILWYVDGTQRFASKEGIPSEPMYLIANLAVGGDWPGMPDATTEFPKSMDVDYIRVYQR